VTFAVGGKAAGRRVVRERTAPLQQEDQAERRPDRGPAARVLRKAQRSSQEEDHGGAQASSQAGLSAPSQPLRTGSVQLQLSSSLTRAERALVKSAALEDLLIGALADLGLAAVSVNCRLANPREVRRLNRKFADHDETTDVLAFPARAGEGAGDFLMPPSEANFIGDIVISVATAVEQAPEGGGDAAAELRLLAVHALLHLLGHDHDRSAQAARMTAATRRLLARDASRRGLSAPAVPQLPTQA
jgi:probable rRNA maturation factor